MFLFLHPAFNSNSYLGLMDRYTLVPSLLAFDLLLLLLITTVYGMPTNI